MNYVNCWHVIVLNRLYNGKNEDIIHVYLQFKKEPIGLLNYALQTKMSTFLNLVTIFVILMKNAFKKSPNMPSIG